MVEKGLSFEKVKAISEGVETISDGRVFLLDITCRDGKLYLPELIPPTLSELGITYKDEKVELNPVGSESPLSCRECGRLFNRDLVFHNILWMVTVLSCSAHKRSGLLDLFPKMDGASMGHDWTNAFLGFDTSGRPPFIVNAQSADEYYQEWIKKTSAEYRLTPTGLSAILRP